MERRAWGLLVARGQFSDTGDQLVHCGVEFCPFQVREYVTHRLRKRNPFHFVTRQKGGQIQTYQEAAVRGTDMTLVVTSPPTELGVIHTRCRCSTKWYCRERGSCSGLELRRTPWEQSRERRKSPEEPQPSGQSRMRRERVRDWDPRSREWSKALDTKEETSYALSSALQKDKGLENDVRPLLKKVLTEESRQAIRHSMEDGYHLGQKTFHVTTW